MYVVSFNHLVLSFNRVVDVVVREVPTAPKESKCPFILMPMEGSGLPQLKTSRLNAPRILQVHKVYTYCQVRSN